MKLRMITDTAPGLDGRPRYWTTVFESNGSEDLAALYKLHGAGCLPVAYVTDDHLTRAAAVAEARDYIARHARPR